MNRSTHLERRSWLKTAPRGPQHQLRSVLEPLEDRVLLAALNWTIVQAQSSVTIAIPDQDFEVDDGGTR